MQRPELARGGGVPELDALLLFLKAFRRRRFDLHSRRHQHLVSALPAPPRPGRSKSLLLLLALLVRDAPAGGLRGDQRETTAEGASGWVRLYGAAKASRGDSAALTCECSSSAQRSERLCTRSMAPSACDCDCMRACVSALVR